MDSASQGVILDRVYQAAVQPSLWATVLDDIISLTNGECAAFTRLNIEDGSGSAIVAKGDTSRLQEYFDYYYAINPLQLIVDTATYKRQWSPKILRDEDCLPRATFEATEYYNDYIKPVGAEWSMIVRLGLDGSDVTAINIGRSTTRGRFENAELNSIVWLYPHLIRASRLGRHVTSLQEMNDGLATALDHSSTAMLLVDASGTILHANAPSDRMLARGDVLCARRGRITAPTHGPATALAHAIAQAAMPGWESRRSSEISLPTTGHRLPCTALVVPLRMDEDSDIVRNPAVLVSVIEPGRGRPIPDDTLIECFALTNAELRLAKGLARGEGLRDLADTFGISVNTVRVQLASLFAKTDTNRQIDLVKLVLGL